MKKWIALILLFCGCATRTLQINVVRDTTAKVVGTNTKFTSCFKVGDTIKIEITPTLYVGEPCCDSSQLKLLTSKLF